LPQALQQHAGPLAWRHAFELPRQRIETLVDGSEIFADVVVVIGSRYDLRFCARLPSIAGGCTQEQRF